MSTDDLYLQQCDLGLQLLGEWFLHPEREWPAVPIEWFLTPQLQSIAKEANLGVERNMLAYALFRNGGRKLWQAPSDIEQFLVEHPLSGDPLTLRNRLETVHQARELRDRAVVALAKVSSQPVEVTRAALLELSRPPATRLIEPSSLATRLRSRIAGLPRVSTGIEPLDKLCRGGLRPGTVVVIGGAPGAGKTTLVVQLSRHFARLHGVAIAHIAYDEGIEAVDERNMRASGIARAVAENLDESAISHAVDELGGLPIDLYDGVSVEVAINNHARRYPNQSRAVVIDSIQTAYSDTAATLSTRRDRMDELLRSVRALAKAEATRCIVLMTSELARGGYAAKKEEDRTDDLAVFKESGGIEYAVDLALVLRRAPGEHTLFKAKVAKTRIGQLGTFALRIDPETTVLEPEDTEEEPLANVGSSYEAACDSVLAFIHANPQVSTSVIIERTKLRERLVRAALDTLQRNGAVKASSKGKGSSHRWHAIGHEAQPVMFSSDGGNYEP